MSGPEPRLSAAEVERIIHEGVPESVEQGLAVTAITDVGAVVCSPYREIALRPGGTISGPTMMALADAAMYAALLGRLGDVRMAVTSELSARFLRRPAPVDLEARAEIVRLGRRQAVIEVRIYSVGDPDPVALVVGTYALPARADAR